MRIISYSENDTMDAGRALAKSLKGGQVVALFGDLGAGKTVFVKGLAAGLGLNCTVLSPTFTLLNMYKGDITLCHYDAYRLSGEQQAEERGLNEFFYAPDFVCVIEWPQRIAGLLNKVVSVHITAIDEQKREIIIENDVQINKS